MPLTPIWLMPLFAAIDAIRAFAVDMIDACRFAVIVADTRLMLLCCFDMRCCHAFAAMLIADAAMLRHYAFITPCPLIFA